MSRALATASLAALVTTLALLGCGSSADEAPAIGGDYGAFFGVAPTETPTEEDFARMAAGGIGSYRLLLSWPSVEVKKGSYDWSAYDAEFRNLATYGIEPVPFVIGTSPAYADGSAPPTVDERTFDGWARFLRAAAERYGPDGDYWQSLSSSDPGIPPQPVRTWEIWNEPNSSVFWTPEPDPNAYAKLFKRSARVIESVDPNAGLMTAGMFLTPQSPGAINSIDFLSSLYDRRGIADAVDDVGIHPYGPTVRDALVQVVKTRKLIDQVGDDAPLWVTEIGWGSDPSSPNELAKTPEQQAKLLSGSLGKLLQRREELNVAGVIWFTWRDVDNATACGWCDAAGLVDSDRDSKPAWLAFTDLTGGTP